MPNQAESSARPPQPKKIPQTLTAHCDTRVDPYYWIRNREDPDVELLLAEENAYFEDQLKPGAALAEEIFQEIKSRVQETDMSVPVTKGGWLYYSRTQEGLQYPIHCRKSAPDTDSPEGTEQVILDENDLAGKSAYFALGAFDVSPDHRLLAYSVDLDGSELYELSVVDLETGRAVGLPVKGTYYSTAWSASSRSVFYTRTDESMRPYQVWRHDLDAQPHDLDAQPIAGTKATTETKDIPADHLVYEEPDEHFYVGVSLTKDEAFVVVSSGSKTTSEVRVIPASDPSANPRVIAPRVHGTEYSVEHFGSQFVIVTNRDAEDFKVVVAPEDNPSAENWEDLVPHSIGTRIEDVDVFSSFLALYLREGGCSRIHVLEVDSPGFGPLKVKERYSVSQPEDVSTAWGSSNPDFTSVSLRYEYSSLVTPRSVFELDTTNRSITLLKAQPVLGGYDPAKYTTYRLLAEAADGTAIPISVVHSASLQPSQETPTLLYGYGSYEISIDPYFSVSRLSLLDRGFVFAIAHIRGGGEMGRSWYLDGKMLNKANTFSDFVACAKHLIGLGITSPEKLAIRGGSAGGLLIGAVLNLEPELFKAAVAEVPFVDTLTTILDETLPLTVGEWEEWGNPVEDANVYRYMKGYSPYDNVRAFQAYPMILATAGLNDPRVAYWEPAKWASKIRDANPNNWIVLKTEMGAGHQGPSGRYDSWREEATVLAFLVSALSSST